MGKTAENPDGDVLQDPRPVPDIHRGKTTRRDARRKPRDDEAGTGRRDVASSQATLESRGAERGRKDPPFEPPEGAQPCDTLSLSVGYFFLLLQKSCSWGAGSYSWEVADLGLNLSTSEGPGRQSQWPDAPRSLPATCLTLWLQLSMKLLPPGPQPSATRAQVHPEGLLGPQPCPKRKPHSWRPEHQKFIELSTFLNKQLTTYTGVGCPPVLLFWTRTG